jgi:hypothetical protein
MKMVCRVLQTRSGERVGMLSRAGTHGNLKVYVWWRGRSGRRTVEAGKVTRTEDNKISRGKRGLRS